MDQSDIDFDKGHKMYQKSEVRFFRDSNNPLKLPTGRGYGTVHPDILFFPLAQAGYRYWLFYTPYPPDEAERPFLVRSNNGKNFTETGIKNPLLDIGPSGSWDDHHLADIDITKVRNKWYMYYAGAQYNGAQKQVKIGLAESTNGKNWTKYSENPVLYPEMSKWYEKGVRSNTIITATPSVIYEGNKFYMWYSARGDDCVDRICLAESADGKNWVKHNQNPVLEPTEKWEGMAVNHQKVIYYDDRYWMYYVGQGKGNYRLGLATSFDKLNWVKKGVVMVPTTGWENKHIYRSCPIKVGDNVFLYYSAYGINNTCKKLCPIWSILHRIMPQTVSRYFLRPTMIPKIGLAKSFGCGDEF